MEKNVVEADRSKNKQIVIPTLLYGCIVHVYIKYYIDERNI